MRECRVDQNLFSFWLGFGSSVVEFSLWFFLCVLIYFVSRLRKEKRGMGKLVEFLHVGRVLALLRIALVSLYQPLTLLSMLLSSLI